MSKRRQRRCSFKNEEEQSSKSLELWQGGKLEIPWELTQVSDRGEQAPPTPPQLQGRRGFSARRDGLAPQAKNDVREP
ncbi:hypothetical protein [Serratia sp. M24T3]|uniref:hypothetical protein n=1 Tax=Serratia sp. M24T3 TaxID=932213 RepID=UPI00025BBEDA|nr:hypothetical protein [Serratia sp. M24T3]EIC83044.1 hypothetical protein SPM24T3_18656 [Serratia sp. M24T3]